MLQCKRPISQGFARYRIHAVIDVGMFLVGGALFSMGLFLLSEAASDQTTVFVVALMSIGD
jgi:hypothetical protein